MKGSDSADTLPSKLRGGAAHLIRERLNLAAKMLQHQSFAHLPASTIAFDAGFKDQSHFSRTFLAHYRITPGRWRKTKALSTKTQN